MRCVDWHGGSHRGGSPPGCTAWTYSFITDLKTAIYFTITFWDAMFDLVWWFEVDSVLRLVRVDVGKAPSHLPSTAHIWPRWGTPSDLLALPHLPEMALEEHVASSKLKMNDVPYAEAHIERNHLNLFG